MAIRFNSTSVGYARMLSTFYPDHVIYMGRVWPTAEHAYQAAKTDDERIKEIIRDAPSPAYAKKIGSTMLLKTSIYDWNKVRVYVMKEIIKSKITGNHKLKSWLLHPSNFHKEIIHEAPWDPFWGDGPDGKGQNMLGKIYMELRTELVAKS